MAAKKTKGGRPTEEQLAVRKARVIDVARELFLARGFAGTPVSDIARISGVSPRLITSHFGDKANIFTAIFNQAADRAFSAAAEIGEGDALDEVLFRAARFAWTVAYTPTAISFLRMVVSEGERMSEMTSTMAERASIHFFGEMETIFKGLIARGLVPDADVAMMARYFVDLVIGFSLIQAGMGFWDRVSDEADLRRKVAFFCKAIGVDVAGPTVCAGSVQRRGRAGHRDRTTGASQRRKPAGSLKGD